MSTFNSLNEITGMDIPSGVNPTPIMLGVDMKNKLQATLVEKVAEVPMEPAMEPLQAEAPVAPEIAVEQTIETPPEVVAEQPMGPLDVPVAQEAPAMVETPAVEPAAPVAVTPEIESVQDTTEDVLEKVSEVLKVASQIVEDELAKRRSKEAEVTMQRAA